MLGCVEHELLAAEAGDDVVALDLVAQQHPRYKSWWGAAADVQRP